MSAPTGSGVRPSRPILTATELSVTECRSQGGRMRAWRVGYPHVYLQPSEFKTKFVLSPHGLPVHDNNHTSPVIGWIITPLPAEITTHCFVVTACRSLSCYMATWGEPISNANYVPWIRHFGGLKPTCREYILRFCIHVYRGICHTLPPQKCGLAMAVLHRKVLL